jgi:hypothetical protein
MAGKEKTKSCVPVGKLKNNLRRLHGHCPEKKKVLKRTKVDLSTNKCEKCNTYIYSGVSESRYQELVLKYPTNTVIKGKLDVHHLNAVVDPEKGFTTWDDYINRLWVKADQMMGLCEICHGFESSEEMNLRKESGSMKRKK